MNTNHMEEIVRTSEHLANAGDRTLFISLVIVFGGCLLWAVRYLVARDERRDERHGKMVEELKAVVLNNTATVATCQVHINRNTEVLTRVENHFDRTPTSRT